MNEKLIFAVLFNEMHRDLKEIKKNVRELLEDARNGNKRT